MLYKCKISNSSPENRTERKQSPKKHRKMAQLPWTGQMRADLGLLFPEFSPSSRMLESSLAFVNEGTHTSMSLGACLHWGHRIKQEEKTVYGHAWSEWYGILKSGVSFLVTTNPKTRENVFDNWCHTAACCDMDFCMCPRQWVSALSDLSF